MYGNLYYSTWLLSVGSRLHGHQPSHREGLARGEIKSVSVRAIGHEMFDASADLEFDRTADRIQVQGLEIDTLHSVRHPDISNSYFFV